MLNKFSKKDTGTGKKNGKIASTYLVIILIISAFLWGMNIGSKNSKTAGGNAGSEFDVVGQNENRSKTKLDFDQFWDLWEVVNDRYVEQPVDEKDMFYGAMAGVVASLGDPYSIFLDPEGQKEFTQELSGKFEGIGAEIGIKKGNLTIIAPLPDSPAERGGLKPGDQIVAVDGSSTRSMTIDQAVRKIRGDKGTEVKLLIMRKSFESAQEFPITRDTIKIQSVKTDMGVDTRSPNGKKLVVIKITHFNGDTVQRFVDAVSDLQLKDVDGIILDLRNNPGGFLDGAIRILGEWLPGEIVVSERYSNGLREDDTATGLGRLKDIQTVVLVNGGSASASEIMAGALQDYGKAKLIGQQTFGKGSVQDLISFKDGSAVKLTIAEWLTPSGININKEGITPDFVVERTEEDYDNDLDPQLEAAKAFFDGVIPDPPPDETAE